MSDAEEAKNLTGFKRFFNTTTGNGRFNVSHNDYHYLYKNTHFLQKKKGKYFANET